MSKFLLINPAFNIAKANYDSSVSVGLLSIASYLDHQGIEIVMIDGARQKNYLALIKQYLPECNLAGLSVMTTQIPAALEISKLIREIKPDCQIIWGGTHPTFFPEQTASHPFIDIVCVGEGEQTLLEIASGEDLAEIKGIAYKKDEQIITNPVRPLGDPSQMPLFNWNLVSKEVLENLKLVPTLTSRGCPHRCTFCINAILKNRWRPRTVEQVLVDLKIIKENKYLTGKNLRFWDENFFVDINRAKAITAGMIDHNLVMPWETTVRVNYLKAGMIDEEFLALLSQSGCYLLSFGAESGSPRILEKIQKDITPEEIISSAKLCLKYKIIPQYSFMIGLPGETKDDMMMTLKLIDRLLKLGDEVQILGPQAFRPYPGSALYRECLDSGWREPSSLEQWDQLIKNELNYLNIENYPWVVDKEMVESMEAYVRFGAHSFKSALSSTIKAQKLLKLSFILLCKLRWKLKFFNWPIEYKLAKRFVTK